MNQHRVNPPRPLASRCVEDFTVTFKPFQFSSLTFNFQLSPSIFNCHIRCSRFTLSMFKFRIRSSSVTFDFQLSPSTFNVHLFDVQFTVDFPIFTFEFQSSQSKINEHLRKSKKTNDRQSTNINKHQLKLVDTSILHA